MRVSGSTISLPPRSGGRAGVGGLAEVSVIRLRARVAALRCALCHDDLGGDALASCACGTILHLECRATLGRCPTLGCRPRVSAETSSTIQGEPVRFGVRLPRPLRSFVDFWADRPMLLWCILIVLAGLVVVVVTAEGSALAPFRYGD